MTPKSLHTTITVSILSYPRSPQGCQRRPRPRLGYSSTSPITKWVTCSRFQIPKYSNNAIAHPIPTSCSLSPRALGKPTKSNPDRTLSPKSNFEPGWSPSLSGRCWAIRYDLSAVRLNASKLSVRSIHPLHSSLWVRHDSGPKSKIAKSDYVDTQHNLRDRS